MVVPVHSLEDQRDGFVCAEGRLEGTNQSKQVFRSITLFM